MAAQPSRPCCGPHPVPAYVVCPSRFHVFRSSRNQFIWQSCFFGCWDCCGGRRPVRALLSLLYVPCFQSLTEAIILRRCGVGAAGASQLLGLMEHSPSLMHVDVGRCRAGGCCARHSHPDPALADRINALTASRASAFQQFCETLPKDAEIDVCCCPRR